MNTPEEEKIRLCLLKLLNNNDLRFFGYIAYNLDFKIQLDDNIQNISDNQIQNNKFNRALKNRDAILNYNKETNKFELVFFNSFLKNNNISKILFIIIHNVLHILNHHNLRQNGKDKTLFNLAADHVINKELQLSIAEGNLAEVERPDNYQIINELYHENLTTEQVYNWLKEKNKPNKKESQKYKIESNSQQNNDLNEINSNQENNENNTEEKNDNENNTNENNKYINKDSIIDINYREVKSNSHYYDTIDVINIDNIKTISKNNNPAITQLNEIKSTAALLLEQDSISRGFKAGNLLNYLKEITKVEVPWYKLLEKAILVNITSNPDTRTWTNPMKRLRAHGIILPGTGLDKNLDTLVICIDTSGSISDKNLKIFAGICMDSCSKFKKIWLLKHDVSITQNVIINSNEIDKEKIICKMDGRGGTNHRDVYNKIEEQYHKNDLKLGLILFLTDFESNIQRIYKNYEWTKVIPIIHIITDPRNMKYIPKDLDNSPITINEIL